MAVLVDIVVIFHEVWSLAEPDVTDGAAKGKHNTFAFGLRFDRPLPALARGLATAAAVEVPGTTAGPVSRRMAP